MARNILPSGHLLEAFMPYRDDEARMLAVMEQTVSLGYFKNLELPSFQKAESRKSVRKLLESNGLTATTFVTPYVKAKGLALCDLDAQRRREALELCKKHADYAAECGYIHFGVPSGDDPGDAKREDAKKVMTDSAVELAEYLKGLGMYLTLEPLDRFAYKKQLLGPMEEVCEWFAPVKAACPNAYLHWDSAHEALGGIDLMDSIAYCAPFLGQFHLCDAITDVTHPCFGDLHMDVARAPQWKTEGFLTPEVGAQIIRKVASYEAPAGIDATYVSVEILGHHGDDLWLKLENGMAFLKRCLELAEVGNE